MSVEEGEESAARVDEQTGSVFISRWLVFNEASYATFVRGQEQGDEGDWSLLVALTNIEDFEDNLRAKIVLEFLFQSMVFCRENAMDYTQAARYMSVVCSIYEHSCVLEPLSTQSSAIESFQMQMNDLARELRPAVPPGGTAASTSDNNNNDVDRAIATSAGSAAQTRLFSIDMMKSMATFFSRTFLRYFAAYQYVHGTLPELKLVHCVETIDTLKSDEVAAEAVDLAPSHVESV